MRKQSFLLLLIGILIGILISITLPNNVTLKEIYDSTLTLAQDSFSGNAPERDSPKERIDNNNIELHHDKVIIYLNDPRIARFADTNSMDPVLDTETKAIQIVPLSPEDIQQGDIITYYSTIAKTDIIHRVIETGYDDKGWYAILKGDNLARQDPEKVRFDQVKRVTIGLIY